MMPTAQAGKENDIQIQTSRKLQKRVGDLATELMRARILN